MHCSEKRGLCKLKMSNKMLQNLPYYFWNKKTQIYFFFISSNFGFRKSKWKLNKKYLGFLIPKYGKFWSISLDNFIKHIPIISEECYLYNVYVIVGTSNGSSFPCMYYGHIKTRIICSSLLSKVNILPTKHTQKIFTIHFTYLFTTTWSGPLQKHISNQNHETKSGISVGVGTTTFRKYVGIF